MNESVTRSDSLIVNPQTGSRSHPPNVGMGERMGSLFVGAGLVLSGLSRRSPGGLVASVAGAALIGRGWTGYCRMYDYLGLNSAVPRHAGTGVRAQHGRKVTHTLQVNRDRQELYQYWRRLEHLPEIFQHLKSVEAIDERRSLWTAYAPGGRELSWEAQIITDTPGEIIAWESLEGSEVDTAGSVRFSTSENGKGTDLRISLKYDPPGGLIVDRIAHLLRHGLGDLLEEDLRLFKQKMETGETATNSMWPAQAR